MRAWHHFITRIFKKRMRCLCGQPISIGSLNEGFRTGFQRQRMSAVLKLAIHQPGTSLFENHAPLETTELAL